MSILSSLLNRHLWAAPALFTATALHICAQSPGAISTPLVGMFATAAEVRPIEGVPGASVVGEPIGLPGLTTRVFLAPLQRWALVDEGRGAGLELIPFDGAVPGKATPIAGALPDPERLAFSPNGRNAILYSRLPGTVQVLSHLDGAAQLAGRFDASSLNDVTQLAISDDGVPVALTRSGAIYLLQPGNAPAPLFSAGSPAAIAFLPNQSALAVVDGAAAAVTILDNLADRPSTRMVLSAPALSGEGIFAAAGSDGNSLIFAVSGGQMGYRADLTNQTISVVSLPVSVTRFDQVRPDLFLLSAKAGEPAWLLLVDGATLRAGFAQVSRGPNGIRNESSVRQ